MSDSKIDDFKKISWSWSSILFIYTFLIYAVGFFIWNCYLNKFGFFEYDLIQTRFISTGFIALSPFLILIAVLMFRSLSFIKKYCLILSLFISLLGLIWLFIFGIYLFPKFPQYYAGGKPFAVSLIVNPSDLDNNQGSDILRLLDQLNIDNEINQDGKVSSIQTTYGCMAYINKDYFIFWGKEKSGENSRTLILRKSLFSGYDVSKNSTKKCGLKD